MRYLHTMIRVTDLDASLEFFCDKLGLKQVGRDDYEERCFSLIFLGPEGQGDAQVEFAYNWDPEELSGGRNFGYLAYEVDDIYATCRKPMDRGVTINRSPDNVSNELLQKGEMLAPQESWAYMENIDEW